MLAKDWLNPSVISIRSDDTVVHAAKLQKSNTAGILLVYDEGKLVGVVADQDLQKAFVPELLPMDRQDAESFVSGIKVKQIMSLHPLTVKPDYTMEEVAEILLKNKISAVPVVNDKEKVIGIISRSDVLEFIKEVTGTDKIGYQLNFSVLDEPGYIYDIVEIIKDYDGRIWNMLCNYHGVQAGFRNVSLRVYNIKPEIMPELIKRVKGKSLFLYVVDFIDNKRGLY
jgi:acetoin utilization protein AcuB